MLNATVIVVKVLIVQIVTILNAIVKLFLVTNVLHVAMQKQP